MKVCQKEVHDDRSDQFNPVAWVFVLLLTFGEIPGENFTMTQIITAAVALALIVYLFVSIFKPEKFN